MKVYELAKELNCDSKTIIQHLGKIGCEVKNHMSVIDENFAQRIREKFAAGEIKKGAAGKTKAAEASSPNGFVPRVVRIPKATATEEAMEQEKKTMESDAVEQKETIVPEKIVSAPGEKIEPITEKEEKKVSMNNENTLAKAEEAKNTVAPEKEKPVVSAEEKTAVNKTNAQPLPKEKTTSYPNRNRDNRDNRDNRYNKPNGERRPDTRQNDGTRPARNFDSNGNRPMQTGDRKPQGQYDNKYDNKEKLLIVPLIKTLIIKIKMRMIIINPLIKGMGTEQASIREVIL